LSRAHQHTETEVSWWAYSTYRCTTSLLVKRNDMNSAQVESSIQVAMQRTANNAKTQTNTQLKSLQWSSTNKVQNLIYASYAYSSSALLQMYYHLKWAHRVPKLVTPYWWVSVKSLILERFFTKFKTIMEAIILN